MEIFSFVLAVCSFLFSEPALEKALGHPEYKAREFAQAALTSLWPTSRSTLTRAASSQNPEVAIRAAEALKGCLRVERVEARARSDFRVEVAFNGQYPCLDALWYCTEKHSYKIGGGSELGHRIAKEYEDRTYNRDDPLPFPSHRTATGKFFKDLHAAGTPTWALKILAAEMYRRDYDYYRSIRFPWYGPDWAATMPSLTIVDQPTEDQKK